VLLWARYIRKFGTPWIFLGQIASDIIQSFELRPVFWFKNDLVASFLDDNFRPFEAKLLGQTHRLTASVLEKFSRGHIYKVYLHLAEVKIEPKRRDIALFT